MLNVNELSHSIKGLLIFGFVAVFLYIQVKTLLRIRRERKAREASYLRPSKEYPRERLIMLLTTLLLLLLNHHEQLMTYLPT